MTQPPPVLSVEAEAYLNEALALMQDWSINRNVIDWERLERTAFQLADGAEKPEDTYRAIESTVRGLRDDHSTFMTPSQARSFDQGTASFDAPAVEVMEDGIGYVSIGRYRGNIGPQADEYAAALASEIAEAMEDACGWIVDLSSNTGGNMWPMIAGLAPLLGGEGQIGSFTYPGGLVEPWTLEDGSAWWDEERMTTHGVEIPSAQPPVAVLIAGRTASSGEATAIAFRGRPDTRLFGQATAGLTTSNEPLYLSDGAMLALTMSVFTDRNGDTFGQNVSIQPDQSVEGDAIPLAVDWLRTNGC